MPRILTWNIRHGGADKPGIADAIAEMQPDLAVITEFRQTRGRGDLVEELRSRGFGYVSHSAPAAKTNGVLIASKYAMEPGPLCDLEGASHRWVQAHIAELAIEVVGAYLPNWRHGSTEKQVFWDWMLTAAESLSHCCAVMAGDWNTGSHLFDEAGRTLRCTESFEALSKFGWRDTYRILHPSGSDRSWWSNAGNGFRLDHVFFSPTGPASPTRVEYLIQAGTHRLVSTPGRSKALSDHAALVVDF